LQLLIQPHNESEVQNFELFVQTLHSFDPLNNKEVKHICTTSSLSNLLNKNIRVIVATLALGWQPRQRGCKGAGQEEAWESHHRLPGV